MFFMEIMDICVGPGCLPLTWMLMIGLGTCRYLRYFVKIVKLICEHAMS